MTYTIAVPKAPEAPNRSAKLLTETAPIEAVAYTVPETAKLLNIPVDTCYDQVRAGVIPAVRFGKHWRVPKVALDRLMAGE